MAEFNPDDIIGTYRVVRFLGKGAMGAVYEVVHTQLGTHYALKSFTLEKGHVDILKDKFLAEGRVLARLHHPHVVRVFDLNFDEATPAADVYSLAVMIVYLLTGIWYEPGSRALELLETLELPWAKVLPQMLAEDPAERPVNLCALAKLLEVPTSEAKTVAQPSEGQSPMVNKNDAASPTSGGPIQPTAKRSSRRSLSATQPQSTPRRPIPATPAGS